MPLPPRDPANPNWPLPADYKSLTVDGQRQARVALCQSWYDRSKPWKLITDPEAFCAAFAFWKTQYHKKNPVNTAKYTHADAPMHQEWVRRFAHNHRTVFTCFRGSGKTFIFGEQVAEFITSCRPSTPIIYMTSAQDLAELRTRAVKQDLEENQLLIDDFGKMRPARGSSFVWRNEWLELSNRSVMASISFEKRQRGLTMHSQRPMLGLMDDWEVDYRAKNPQLRSDAEDYLFNVFFPMFEPKAFFVWGNTLLSINAWAVKATKKLDSRFKHWVTGQWDMFYTDENGERKSNWPARYSLDYADAMAGDGTAEIIGIGQVAFGQEMMNQPGAKDDKAFEFDPKRHTFHWEMEGDRRIIVDHETEKRIPYEELKERSIGIVGTDLATGRGKRGCRAAVNASRVDDDNRIWVCEVWERQATPMDTLYHALALGEFWEALAVAVERIAFVDIAISLLDDEIWRRRAQNKYVPDVLPINHAGAESKIARALKMQWRFRENKIKIPVQGPEPLTFCDPIACESLEEQIRLFTPLGGNLAYVDALDGLVAVHEAFEKLGRVVTNPKRAQTMLELMKAARSDGLVYWPGGNRVDARKMSDQIMKEREKPPDTAWSVFDDEGSIFEDAGASDLFSME